MKGVFADTSFFIALLNSHDQLAEAARRQANGLAVPLVTSWWVLTETANFLRHPDNRRLFGELVDRLQHDDSADVVASSDDILQRAIELYRSRVDKEWSLTDCTSFAIMHDRSLTDALTGDHHFEQAGFTVLLS